jgi:hypothetical protein
MDLAALRYSRDHAKQTVGVVIRTGGKEKLIVLAVVPVVTS